MLEIAICDDHIDDLSYMTEMINQYRLSRHIHCEFAVFTNGLDLISILEKGKNFDIYCLDIIMPAFSGIELAKEIRSFDKSAAILFFSSSPEYALDSYSVQSLNYVLKPVSKEKLFSVFDNLLDQINARNKEDTIIVKSHHGIQKILISNLVFVEVMGRTVLYHLLSGKVIQCSESFSAVCDNLLKFGCFIKPHRSYLVNMQYVDTITNHQMTLQTLNIIPVAQGKAREIKQQYLNYQLEGEYP